MRYRHQRSVWRVIVILALLGGLLLGPIPPPAAACSCIMPGTPAQEFQRVDAVFVGTVRPAFNFRQISIVGNLLGQLPNAPYGRPISFTVSQSWRGVTTTNAVVWTGYGGGDCGYGFNVGTQYVVYAYEYQGELSTGICTRTASVANAAQDLQYLQTQPTISLQSTFPWFAVCIGVGLLSALLLATGGWIWRRRRHMAAK